MRARCGGDGLTLKGCFVFGLTTIGNNAYAITNT